MLDTLLLKQLNDPDPSVRKKAVIALGKTQDQDALPYLATVYKKDRDPEIRQLAKKAGVYIKQQTADIFPASAQVTSGGAALTASNDDDLMSSASTYYEELVLPEPDPVVEVSELNQERAKGLLQQALDANLRGNNDKAIHYLQNALKRNPNLKRDSYALSMASTITGIPSGERAMETLLEDVKKKKRGGGGGEQSEEGATWSNALIDLLIYGLINAAVVGVSLYLFFAVFLPPFSEALAQQVALVQSGGSTQSNPLVASLSGMSPADIMYSIMNNFSTPFTLIYSGVYGAASIVGLVIFYLFIHLVSTTILGGEGTFRRLITKATLPQAFLIPFLTVVSVGSIFLPTLNPDLGSLPTFISIGLSILYYSVLSSRIGVAYRFSSATGCGAITLASIGIGLVGCTLIFILTSIASNGLVIR
jgi:HEAT repeat protein